MVISAPIEQIGGMPTTAQWAATWSALGAEPPAGVYDELMARHAEPQRHYHTPRHLDECFAALAAVRPLAEHPPEVELAVWFHDAVYDPKRHDNEQQSADWARSVVERSGLDPAVGARVAGLILATRHDATPSGADAEVLVDVDLAILGAPPERFDEYERDIRAEYAWVPTTIFARKRRALLERLLARERLFATPAMREAHEQRARANLARSIARLDAASRPRHVKRVLGAAVVAISLAGGFLSSPTWFAFALAGAVWLFYEFTRPQL
jgi:predicted metal-dependent HD superfamily phosphohydrolase